MQARMIIARFHGIQPIDLSSIDYDALCKSWRKSVRFTRNLHPMTLDTLLLAITGSVNVENRIHFYINGLNHYNEYITYSLHCLHAFICAGMRTTYKGNIQYYGIM